MKRAQFLTKINEITTENIEMLSEEGSPNELYHELTNMLDPEIEEMEDGETGVNEELDFEDGESDSDADLN